MDPERTKTVVLVCGSRDYPHRHIIAKAVSRLLEAWGAVVVLNGGASGADALAQKVATELEMPCLTIPAEWSKHGKAAGPLRNARMLRLKPRVVLAFFTGPGRSRGTANMVRQAQEAGVSVREWIGEDGPA